MILALKAIEYLTLLFLSLRVEIAQRVDTRISFIPAESLSAPDIPTPLLPDLLFRRIKYYKITVDPNRFQKALEYKTDYPYIPAIQVAC